MKNILIIIIINGLSIALCMLVGYILPFNSTIIIHIIIIEVISFTISFILIKRNILKNSKNKSKSKDSNHSHGITDMSDMGMDMGMD